MWVFSENVLKYIFFKLYLYEKRVFSVEFLKLLLFGDNYFLCIEILINVI